MSLWKAGLGALIGNVVGLVSSLIIGTANPEWHQKLVDAGFTPAVFVTFGTSVGTFLGGARAQKGESEKGIGGSGIPVALYGPLELNALEKEALRRAYVQKQLQEIENARMLQTAETIKKVQKLLPKGVDVHSLKTLDEIRRLGGMNSWDGNAAGRAPLFYGMGFEQPQAIDEKAAGEDALPPGEMQRQRDPQGLV